MDEANQHIDGINDQIQALEKKNEQNNNQIKQLTKEKESLLVQMVTEMSQQIKNAADQQQQQNNDVQRQQQQNSAPEQRGKISVQAQKKQEKDIAIFCENKRTSFLPTDSQYTFKEIREDLCPDSYQYAHLIMHNGKIGTYDMNSQKEKERQNRTLETAFKRYYPEETIVKVIFSDKDPQMMYKELNEMTIGIDCIGSNLGERSLSVPLDWDLKKIMETHCKPTSYKRVSVYGENQKVSTVSHDLTDENKGKMKLGTLSAVTDVAVLVFEDPIKNNQRRVRRN